MSNPATEIMIEGRVVNGHPMTRRGVTRKLPGAAVETPVLQSDGVTPMTEAYIAVAIPKAGSVDWKTTPWGQQIYARAVADWPNGEYGAPTFAWKIADGDSQIPNQKGKKPAEREGWAGHWILHCNTQLGIRCHHVGQYAPEQQIQDANEIKTGDYARVLIGVRGNGPSQSPGVYVNPILFELSRAGQLIMSESGPAAADVFSAGQPQPGAVVQQPQPGAVVQQPVVTPQPQPGVTPAPTFVQPVVKYLDPNGNAFTEAELTAAGYTLQMIQGLQRA